MRFASIAAVPFGLMLSVASTTPSLTWIGRTVTVGLLAMVGYGSCEATPARLPAWLARWVWQLCGVVIAVPLGAYLAYSVTTGGDLRFWRDSRQALGFAQLCLTGFLFAPWIALGAMVRQRDASSREQALTFELERSELERRATDARLRLLQAQVQPHFLFNTLANVRTLVGTASPRAPAVLDSLIAYLRAAVPSLDATRTTIGDELTLVRAYLALMHMRMPDRLSFNVEADDSTLDLACPAMTLLTLVENAVRHGIDPSEVGGRIDVSVRLRDGRCIATVSDTGVGLVTGADRDTVARSRDERDASIDAGTGTGLSTLRERLRLAYGDDATLRVETAVPHGVRAELDFDARDIAGPSS